jgi:cytochrome c-type biogenesis protein CcmE
MRSNKIKIRLVLIVLTISLVVFLLLKTFSDNISFFLKPEEVYLKELVGENFTLGGLVKPGSLSFKEGKYFFILTDAQNHEIIVTFRGILPTLFKENQMSVVTGQLTKKWFFEAEEVLAKHDENYKIKENF